MKLFRMLGRNIRDAVKSVIRNFSLSLASISCITITLLVVSIFLAASYNVNNFTKLMKQDVTIVAFLASNITGEEIEKIEQEIRMMDNVDIFKFESRNDIKDKMQDSSEVFNRIMSNWDEKENPLKDIFLIKVYEIEKIDDTAKAISNLDKVVVVKYGEGMVNKLIVVFKVIERGTAILVLSLLFVAAFLIANTIKITIFSRKREIDIMRLVGASNIIIKLPFIFEGMFLGFLGAILPIIITIYGYNSLFSSFDGQLFSPFIRLVSPESFIYKITIILVVLGVFVGMWGSARAVRRHLKI